jgi:hypothetical protein
MSLFVKEGLENIEAKFDKITGVGPSWVARFLNPSSNGEKERIMADAFMNVNELIKSIKI